MVPSIYFSENYIVWPFFKKVIYFYFSYQYVTIFSCKKKKKKRKKMEHSMKG